MTQFKCDRCGKVDDFGKALLAITDEGKQTYICEECDSKAGLPSENICVCCGEVIPEGRMVCLKCDGIAPNSIHREKPISLADCGSWAIGKKASPETVSVNIHKIIDDAMEKRDRTVSIYIGETGVSVTVSPADQDKCQWIHGNMHKLEQEVTMELAKKNMKEEISRQKALKEKEKNS
jgi:hypothetical protein